MKDGRLVYSTGAPGGADKPRRGPEESLAPKQQAVRVRREVAGRGGKTVTTIRPLFLVRDDATSLLRDLKRLCGSGGTIKEDTAPDGRACWALEVQGDHADKITAALVERGFPAKRAGG